MLLKKSFLGVILALLLMGVSFFAFDPKSVKASTIVVPDDFPAIQEAINSANEGDTIFVRNGTYYENVVVNKTISLVGEDMMTTIIDGSKAGTVVQITADNVSVSGFTVRYSGWGWTNNGIYVHFADNCEIANNYFFTNCHNIRLNYSRGSRVTGNVIDGNGYGIRLIHSDDSEAINNSVSNCIGGIHLEFATNCTVKGNQFTQNGQGIRFYSPCTYNTVAENTVYNNTYDGMIDNTMNNNSTFFANTLFHNNFVNNTHAFICKGIGYIWDNGYPAGGNYWSDYEGIDLYRGPSQNETNSDGIFDNPYVIDAYNIDNFPLAKPYAGPHDLGIKGDASKTVVPQNPTSYVPTQQDVHIHITVINCGEQTETANFTFYINETGMVHETTLILASRDSTTLSFDWNTSGFAKGRYVVANVTPVSGEIDLQDNVVNGVVYIGVPGDVDGNRIVNTLDLYNVALHFGAQSRYRDYIRNYDIDDNDIINTLDLWIAATHYEQTDP